MKTVVITVEVKIDENSIVEKYPNFSINYELSRNLKPTSKALVDFAKRQVTTEDSLKEFGFASKITRAVIKK